MFERWRHHRQDMAQPVPIRPSQIVHFELGRVARRLLVTRPMRPNRHVTLLRLAGPCLSVLAMGFALACGSTEEANASSGGVNGASGRTSSSGSPSGSGGQTTASTSTDGGSSGGTQSSASAGGSGGSDDGTSRSATTASGASTTGTGGTGGGYCPGYEPAQPSELVRCSTQVDCQSETGLTLCDTHGVSYPCGGANFQECTTDENCAEGEVCDTDLCSNSECIPACSEASPCPAPAICEAGHCRALLCSDAGAEPCTAPTVCDVGGANVDAYGCTLLHCSEGWECQEGWDCVDGLSGNDGHGCVHRQCQADSDCDCGSCVNAKCEPQPGFCFPNYPPPVCAAPNTPIATPSGERAIRSLRSGDLVYSVDGPQIVAVPVTRTTRRAVSGHHAVEVVLESGSRLLISPGHPTADHRTFADLARGGTLDGTRIVSARLVPYPFRFTYDILPASESGAYFAGGVLIGSTLH